jgi:undecaprenyl diphosphate synthase
MSRTATLKDRIDPRKLPRHIAIIMDGNGRWAKERGHDRIYGHHEGVQSVKSVVEACGELGIPYLTIYAFSTENWERPSDEVNGIMELLVSTLHKEIDSLREHNIRLHVIGDLDMLPPICRQEVQEAVQLTASHDGLHLIVALSYSSRWEIVQAVKQLAADVRAGKVKPEDIDQQIFAQYLCTAAFPDPELVIRTSGEYRISNFLLYQIAYAELYFTPTLWPDFRKENLYEAILDFQSRERRFGKTSEQIQQNEEMFS